MFDDRRRQEPVAVDVVAIEDEQLAANLLIHVAVAGHRRSGDGRDRAEHGGDRHEPAHSPRHQMHAPQTVLQMTYSETVSATTIERASGRSCRCATVLLIAAFSIIVIYCTSWSLHTIDASSGTVAANMSMSEYRDMLAGVAGFPYQWRMLGSYVVFLGERATGWPAHQVDMVVKTLCLIDVDDRAVLFSRWYTSESGAYCVIGFYLLLTVAGFIGEQYRIYFTNEYVMVRVLVWRGLSDPRRALPAGGGADLRRGLGQRDDAARAHSAGLRGDPVRARARRPGR
jgi:hypothetical protein